MGSCSSKNSSATAVIDINDISNDNLKLIASFLDVPTCLMLAVAFTASPSSPGWKDQNNMILSTASKSILSSLPTSIVLDMADTEAKRDRFYAIALGCYQPTARLASRIVNDDLFAMLTCIMDSSTNTSLKGLKLTECRNIMGSNGLLPLQGCNTLKKVDLSIIGKHERNFNGFNATFSFCQVCGNNAPRSLLNKCQCRSIEKIERVARKSLLRRRKVKEERIIKTQLCRLTQSEDQGALYCNDCRENCDLCSRLLCKSCSDVFECDRCDKSFCMECVWTGEKGESDVEPGMCFECWDRSGSMLNCYCSKDCHDKSVIFSDDHSSFDLRYQSPRCSKRWPLTDPYNASGPNICVSFF